MEKEWTQPKDVVDQGWATKKQVILGIIALFAGMFVCNSFFRSFGIVSPKIAGELNGISLYSWSISLSSLASAFVTLTFVKFSDMYGRRIIMLLSLFLFLAGAIMAALSETYVFYIVAVVVLFLGWGAIRPLCYSVVGDLFPPVGTKQMDRATPIPAGIASASCPILTGIVTDHLGWRYFFWSFVPLVVITGTFVILGVSSLTRRTAHRIDVAGISWLAISLSTTIVCFSWAGSQYSWFSFRIIGLLSASLVFWVIFFWTEARAKEPVLDPQVFTNRTFLTAAGAVVLSSFGVVAVQMYYPLFLQGVQGNRRNTDWTNPHTL